MVQSRKVRWKEIKVSHVIFAKFFFYLSLDIKKSIFKSMNVNEKGKNFSFFFFNLEE